MMRFVLDASMAGALILDDESDDFGEAILDKMVEGGALAPNLLVHEATNLVAMAVRKGRAEPAAARQALKDFLGLPIAFSEPGSAAGAVEVLNVAMKHRITGYDAAYLDLAIREDVALATLDKALRRAAEDEGVRLLPSQI
jgi:predicted nucleic acid-binding protein